MDSFTKSVLEENAKRVIIANVVLQVLIEEKLTIAEAKEVLKAVWINLENSKLNY